MSLVYDSKEDLYIRMEKLQQKLKESEEERNKLEKRCSILIKAFKEEESTYYNALNNKYENFLEDCKFRRRRNDLILRSLCRVEDKARVLQAKTERLKMLKDRYIAYLKHSNFQNELEFSPQNAFPNLPPAENNPDEITQKSVHWKTPYVADFIPYNTDASNINESSQSIKKQFLRNEVQDKCDSDFPRDKLYKYLIENHDQLGDSLMKSDFDKWHKKEETNIDRLSFEKDQPKNNQFIQDKSGVREAGINRPFSPKQNYFEEHRLPSGNVISDNTQKNDYNTVHQTVSQFIHNDPKTYGTISHDKLGRLQSEQNSNSFGKYLEGKDPQNSMRVKQNLEFLKSMVHNPPVYKDIREYSPNRSGNTQPYLESVDNYKETSYTSHSYSPKDSRDLQYSAQNQPNNKKTFMINSNTSGNTQPHLRSFDKYEENTIEKENADVQYITQNQPNIRKSVVYSSVKSQKTPPSVVAKPSDKYEQMTENKPPINFQVENQNIQYSTQIIPNRSGGMYNLRSSDNSQPDLKSVEKCEKTGVDSRTNFQNQKLEDLEYKTNETSNDKDSLNNEMAKASFLRQKGVVQHQQSIDKLKRALSMEEDFENNEGDNIQNVLSNFKIQYTDNVNDKVIEKEDFEMSEKEEHSLKGDIYGISSNETNSNKPVITTVMTNPNKQNHIEVKGIEKSQYNVPGNDNFKTSAISTVITNRNKEGYDGNAIQNVRVEFEEISQPKRNDEEVISHNESVNGDSYPMGLDGVDYQNETYPESYYEQPEHHHDSYNIVSNVILEEDEYELDGEQTEGNDQSIAINQTKTQIQQVFDEYNNSQSSKSSSQWGQSPDRKSFFPNEPFNTTDKELQGKTSESVKISEGHFLEGNSHQLESRESGSDKSVENEIRNESETNEVTANNIGNATHSKLAHLLESDSESFQIEHADPTSGNDDSDFDFSFRQT